MELLISVDDEEFHIPLPDSLAEPLVAQLGRFTAEDTKARFMASLGGHIRRYLEDVLDPDLTPPTEKQIRFAESICRERGLRLPREALFYRNAMNDFLQTHAPQRRNQNLTGKSST